MTSEQTRLLEELRKLSGIIEGIETQRIDLRLAGENERPYCSGLAGCGRSDAP